MPIFQPNARTAETYLAGIGASGALMASAFVLFVILVGVVTFDAWPNAGHLLGGRDGDVSVNSASKSLATPLPEVPNLAKLVAGARSHANGAGQTSSARVSSTAPMRTRGSLSDGNAIAPPSEGQQPVQGEQPPPPVAQSRNVVTQTVSGVGNVVQGTTDSVGDTLGGSSAPGLGGVVGSLGQTVNGTLQSLVGGK